MSEALKGYYCKEPSPGERHGAITIESVGSIKQHGVEMTIENAYQIPDVYQKQVERLSKALYLATAPKRNALNSFQVDLCFVLDTTGSMSGMIKMAKEKIVAITKSIEDCVKKGSDRDAKVRVGFVGYKIKDQPGNLDKVIFTEDTKEVLKVVNEQSATGGSSGGVEDKYEALELAYKFEWTGLVKFLVLIADAPGHGEWCTGTGGLFDNYPERANDMPSLISKIAEEKIYLFYVDISKDTDHERANFRRQYYKSAPDEMKKEGFQELKIASTDDGEKLAGMISESVENIIIAECM